MRTCIAINDTQKMMITCSRVRNDYMLKNDDYMHSTSEQNLLENVASVGVFSTLPKGCDKYVYA